MALIHIDDVALSSVLVISEIEESVTVSIESVPTTVTVETQTVIAEGTMGPPGVRGLKGDKGEPGLSGASFVHTQSIAAEEWVIAHGLGRYPSIIVVDSSGEEVEGGVTYDSSNKITVRFSAPFGGYAYLN